MSTCNYDYDNVIIALRESIEIASTLYRAEYFGWRCMCACADPLLSGQCIVMPTPILVYVSADIIFFVIRRTIVDCVQYW